MHWRLRLLIGLCAAAVCVGLFFAGLWIYRNYEPFPPTTLKGSADWFARHRQDFELIRDGFRANQTIQSLSRPDSASNSTALSALQITMQRTRLLEVQRTEQGLQFFYHKDMGMSMHGGSAAGVIYTPQATAKHPPRDEYRYFHYWETKELGGGWWAFRGTRT